MAVVSKDVDNRNEPFLSFPETPACCMLEFWATSPGSNFDYYIALVCIGVSKHNMDYY